MIGIFDSGIGGLTVVKSIQSLLPQYAIMYLGDTARVPYGNRSPDLVYEFTRQGIDFLFRNGCSLIIVACNTASAEALRKLQQEYLKEKYPEKRVLGVIRPLVEEAKKITKNNKVGVIGTRGTVLSQAYVRELFAQNSTIEVFQSAAPLLVPIIEEGWSKRQEAKKILKYYLRPLKDKKIDTLILGCTHYQMLLSLTREIMGKRCAVLNSAEIVSQSLVGYLARHSEIEATLEKNSNYKYYVTDITEIFRQNAQKVLGKNISLEKVTLE